MCVCVCVCVCASGLICCCPSLRHLFGIGFVSHTSHLHQPLPTPLALPVCCCAAVGDALLVTPVTSAGQTSVSVLFPGTQVSGLKWCHCCNCTDTHRHTDRHTGRHRYTQRHTHTHTHRQTQTHTHTQTDTDTDTQTQTHTHTHRPSSQCLPRPSRGMMLRRLLPTSAPCARALRRR